MTIDEALERSKDGAERGIEEQVMWTLAAEVRRLRDRRYNHDIELAEKLRLTEADWRESERAAVAFAKQYDEAVADRDAARADLDSLRLELAASEHNRVKENQYLLDERDAARAEAARLRQRHAEAVERAYREGFNYAAWHGDNHRLDMGWEQSEARKGLARGDAP